jgi:hypothetical protein
MKSPLTRTILFIASCVFCSCTSTPKDTSEGGLEQSRDSVTVHERSSDAAVVPADSLIIPGRSIGIIELETDAAVVMKKFDKPDAGDAAMGKSVSTWFEGHDATAHTVSIFTAKDVGNSETALIKQIRVTAPGFKTQQGIGTTASLPQLERTFNLQKQKGYKLKQEEVAVYADPAGIAFEIDKKGRCIGIVVYPTGELHPDTYARFLPGISIQ